MFRTNDNVNLFFQIVSLALAIVIIVLGGAYAAWNWYFGRISDPYEPSEAVSIDDQTIRENPAPAQDVPADEEPADAPVS
ncbi:MAG: hypothetical protein J6X30_00245, partial [Clostridia bacterium]|nr:hypothetical protein [Clostridia bacterium]